MLKKLFAVMFVVIGFALAPVTMNAGTEVIRDYGRDQYNYAPRPLPPPRPIYYAPRPPIYFSIFPAFGYYGPRFGYHRFYGHRAYWHRH